MGVVGPSFGLGSGGFCRVPRILPHRRRTGDAFGGHFAVPALGVLRRSVASGRLLRRAGGDLQLALHGFRLVAAVASALDPRGRSASGSGSRGHRSGVPLPDFGGADLPGVGLLVRRGVHPDLLDELLLPRVGGALPDAILAGGGPFQSGCFPNRAFRRTPDPILARLAFEGAVGGHLFLRRGGQAQQRLDDRWLSGADLPRETVGGRAIEGPVALRLGRYDRAVGALVGAGHGIELDRGSLRSEHRSPFIGAANPFSGGGADDDLSWDQSFHPLQ